MSELGACDFEPHLGTDFSYVHVGAHPQFDDCVNWTPQASPVEATEPVEWDTVTTPDLKVLREAWLREAYNEIDPDHLRLVELGETLFAQLTTQLARANAQLNEFTEPCCFCEGSGIEPTGVEHMGTHEFGACMECRGTGLEPRGWEESFREAVTLRANLQLAVSELSQANAVIERVGAITDELSKQVNEVEEVRMRYAPVGGPLDVDLKRIVRSQRFLVGQLRTILEGNGA